jgi:hypothetical protein
MLIFLMFSVYEKAPGKNGQYVTLSRGDTPPPAGRASMNVCTRVRSAAFMAT